MTIDRFYRPYPKPFVQQAVGWMNDRFILPKIARVKQVHLPVDDDGRLRAALSGPFVICPNHPEFFTDWILDKWLMSRYAPRASPWADPAVVNGMGGILRRVWLANGLVAAVRGVEIEKALAYSGENLARGNGALIHPEGEVNWDNEVTGTMRAGAIRIAQRGSELAGKTANIAPLAWFIRFREDATPGLQRELDYVEKRLGLREPRLAGPAQRLAKLYEHLLERESQPFDIELGPRGDGFAKRFDRGLAHAMERLAEVWPEYRPGSLPSAPEDAARAWRSSGRKAKDAPPDFKRQIAVLDKMLRLVPAGVHEPTLTQEQVGERVKRLRLDWLRGSVRDTVTRFIPRAAARRDVFIRVAEPIGVDPMSNHEGILIAVRDRIGAVLAVARQDGLDRLGPPVRYANPFLS
ncbi:MAG: hypothetical protein ABI442_11265 [Gemmatimonadaceae bacterium]